jgi:putative transposase
MIVPCALRIAETAGHVTCDEFWHATRLLILNHAHLMKSLNEYRLHYNRHRPNQSRAQRPPDIQANPPPIVDPAEHHIRRKPILSGLINEYQHAA